MSNSFSEDLYQTCLAQFIAVCRRSQSGYMGTRRHPRGSPLYTRWTLKWRGDDQSLSQFLRATNYDKLSEERLIPLHGIVQQPFVGTRGTLDAKAEIITQMHGY